MRILLLARYGPMGSTSRLRFYQYLPYLKANGIHVDIEPLLDDSYIRRLYAGERQPIIFLLRAYARRLRALLRAGQYDLLWVEKEFLPWLPAAAASFLRVPYVVDYDDAAFHRYDLHASPLVRLALSRKIDRVMRGAALVVAGNDYLAARAVRAGAGRIERLPTVIDAARYRPAAFATGAAFRVGWIGAPVTAGYLRLIEPALTEVLIHGADLTVIGARDPFDGRLPVRERTWAAETEVDELVRLDAGIMPLPDEPFERGKCGYKLVQYMGCSLPVVASPVGVNSHIVQPGVNGYLARTQEEWVAALSRLRADADLRKRLGRAGREKVEREYSLEGAAPRLAGWLKSVV